MNALVEDVCEQEVPDIDWDKLQQDSHNVYDIYTGAKLNEGQVRAGRETEVGRMLEFEVFEVVEEGIAAGHRVWNAGWLDSQKNESLVRSRLVVKQVRGADKREDVFAGTPPLAAMRYVLSRAASRGKTRSIGVWDISVAFFHAKITEEVYVRPPANLRVQGQVWRLKRAMYGTQVASSLWQRLVRETLGAGSWTVLKSIPCVAYNEKEDSLVIFHGDDFFAEGESRALDELDKVLSAFEVKCMPRVGPGWG